MNKLPYLDNMILCSIQRKGWLDDRQLSGLFDCPRSEILSRVEQLLDRQYLTIDSERFLLTEKACQEIIAFEMPAPEEKVALKEPCFSWDEIYVPPLGWDQPR